MLALRVNTYDPLRHCESALFPGKGGEHFVSFVEDFFHPERHSIFLKSSSLWFKNGLELK